MKIERIPLKNLSQAPWRFSENMAYRHNELRFYSPIQHNVELSLKREGQVAPIHVRMLGGPGSYEIVDGHIVVDAARKLGWTEIDAVIHDLGVQEAMLRYILLNLNRCGQYGHYHVKIHRVFKQLWPELTVEDEKIGKNEAKITRLKECLSWPEKRVRDYLELSERDENWQKFMFVPGDEDMQTSFLDDPAEDWQ